MSSPQLILGLMLVAVAGPARSDVELDKGGKFELYSDFRFRLESDWDSRRVGATPRDDRNRARIRFRLGLTFDPTSAISLGLRLRTGSKDSQQSPHITAIDFEGNPTGDEDLLLDKWFLRIKGDRVQGWLGRNGFPFWKQNELFWDDDVTPAGGFLGYELSPGDSKLTLNGGYFVLPDGGVDFHGELGAGQIVYSTQRDDLGFTLAGGMFLFRGEDGAENLRNGNGERDYTIWVGNLQARMRIGGRPLTLGLDLMHNSEDYSAADSDLFTATNPDQTDGFVVSAKWGQTKEKGDWLAAYYYARIETFAVNASYAQDDWVRWGSATQTDSSDLKGHEVRFAYGLGKKANLVARLYLVNAVTSIQDGKRFRIDFNYTF